MPLSEKLLKIMEFARKRAKDPEFLARTAHRRAPAVTPPRRPEPKILTPDEFDRLRQLKRTIADLPAGEFKKK